MSYTNDRPLVLIADDDEIARLFLVETLEQAGFNTVSAADGTSAVAVADSAPFRAAFLDVDMPGLDGYETCRAIRSRPELRHLPIVMITGHDDADSIERAFEAGATDFIAKPLNWNLLPHRLRYILRNADAESRLRYVAYHDPLTGLPNAQALTQHVQSALARAITCADADGSAEPVGLLHLDIQGCERIRSSFGPDAGDQALNALAIRLELYTSAEPGTALARIDGDRFVVCISGTAVRTRTTDLAERLQAVVEEPVNCGSHQFCLALSVGIAFGPEHGSEPQLLLTAAAAAKHHALNSAAHAAVVYAHDIGNRAREHLALEEALRMAVRDEQLNVHFQPKLRISDGVLVGVEALLRWHDPRFGKVPADRFIPIAEESSLILQLGRWVAQAACRQSANWRDQGLDTSVAINLSARQFVHDDPAAFIHACASEAGIDPASIVIEITESALIQDLNAVRCGLIELRKLGCRVAVDDFGTGYSSLAYLRGLPVDELKIDKAFIRNVASDPIDAAICTAILSLARTLDLSVTAEGVETEPQMAWLRKHACGDVQGYLLASPMPAHEILARYADASFKRKAAS
jgi:diguanylate cyclase (GGDEF)-like protein